MPGEDVYAALKIAQKMSLKNKQRLSMATVLHRIFQNWRFHCPLRIAAVLFG